MPDLLVKNRRQATRNLKRSLSTFAKIAIPAAILSWLLYREWDAIYNLLTGPKDRGLLFLSFACLLAATCLSFVRWFFLVIALDLPFTLRDALRLGFLGYLFNFVGPGATGGDLFKAWFLARNQTERRPEAVATILLDRVLGVYSLMVVATIAIMVVGTDKLAGLGAFLNLVILTAVGMTCVFTLLLMPAKFTDWLFNPLSRMPFIGKVFTRVRAALKLYRSRRLWLVGITAMSIGIHFLVAITMHLSDRAVYAVTPKFSEHAVISPLASATGVAPVPGGMGTYELAVDYLYGQIPESRRRVPASDATTEANALESGAFQAGIAAGPTSSESSTIASADQQAGPQLEEGQGFAVAIMYRLMTILIACVGAIYYMLGRDEISRASVALQEQAGSESDTNDV